MIISVATNQKDTPIFKEFLSHYDAFVVEEKTGLQAFKDLKLIDKIQYDQATPLSKQDVYYAFPANDIGKMLAPKVSVAMNKMKADGTFGKIMSKASQ